MKPNSPRTEQIVEKDTKILLDFQEITYGVLLKQNESLIQKDVSSFGHRMVACLTVGQLFSTLCLYSGANTISYSRYDFRTIEDD